MGSQTEIMEIEICYKLFMTNYQLNLRKENSMKMTLKKYDTQLSKPSQ